MFIQSLFVQYAHFLNLFHLNHINSFDFSVSSDITKIKSNVK